MNPYMDKIIEDAGSYAVYGKALGDNMRKDVEYGTDPWKKASGAIPEIAGVDRNFGSRSARIEELNRQIAELESKLKGHDVESEMGKYKFVFDADPSAYMTHQQSLRNAKATEEIRKSNDQKSERETLRNSWKESGTSLLVARYDLADAENAYKQAVSAGDPDGISKAGLALSRAKANYSAKLRENDALRAKVYENFGIKAMPQEEIKDVDLYSADDDENYRSAAVLQRTKNDLNALQKEVKTDNVAIHPTEKKKNIAAWTSRLDALEKQMKDSTLSDKNRGDLELQVQEIREAIRNYGKPAGKGGQTPKVTQADLDKMNFTDLKRKGYGWLKSVRDAGLTHPDLEKAINATRGKK